MHGVRVPAVWPGGADGEGDDSCGWVPGGEVGRLIRIWRNASLPLTLGLRSRGGPWCFHTARQVRSTPSAERRPHNGPDPSRLEWHQDGVQSNYFNSSAMAWTGDMGHVFEAFRRDPAGHMARFRRHPRIGDQAFISDLLVREGRAPRTFKRVLGYDSIVSYQRDRCEGGPPPRGYIVNFHETPTPCGLTTGWVAKIETDP